MNRPSAMLEWVAAAIGAFVWAAGAIAAPPPPVEVAADSPADASADSGPARAAELRRDARQMRDLARIVEEQGKTDVAAQLREDADAAEAEADRLASPSTHQPAGGSDAAISARRPTAAARRAATPDAAARSSGAVPTAPAIDRLGDSAERLAAVDLLYEAAAKLRAAGMRREAARVTRLALKIEANALRR